jgi:hypothetical protein
VPSVWWRGEGSADALLLHAAVSAPEPARAAWRRWSQSRSLDAVDWKELRLLGAVAARSQLLEMTPEQRPRLAGIRRFIWSSTQLRLAGALPVLRRLEAAGVPFCLLKGAALIAGGHLAPGERFIRDVDVLAPRSRLAEAVAILFDAGWKPERYASVEEVFSLGFPRCHALAFRGPGEAGGEIDLHLSAVELGRFPKSDDGLWSRAREARLFGVKALVPAPEDLLVTALVHSYLSDHADDTNWAVDAVALMRSPGLDPELLAREAHRRGVEALLRARWQELASMQAPGLPAGVLRELDALAPDPDLVRELALLGRRRRRRPRADQRVREAARAVRARRLLALEPGATAAEKPPFPAACPWLRLDAPLPEGFPCSGAPQKVELSARILNSAARAPIGFRLYCGSVRLAEGRTRPGAVTGPGRVHRLRASGRLDPAVAAAEGGPPLSLYFGRRSRASSPLGPDAVLVIDSVR